MLYSCALDILSIQLCPSVQGFDSQHQTGYILSSKPLIQEIKTLSSSLKIEENNHLCFYWLYAFIYSTLPFCRIIRFSATKWLYLLCQASDSGNKDTLISSTLKVGEKKTSLFFGLDACQPSYGCFIQEAKTGLKISVKKTPES